MGISLPQPPPGHSTTKHVSFSRIGKRDRRSNWCKVPLASAEDLSAGISLQAPESHKFPVGMGSRNSRVSAVGLRGFSSSHLMCRRISPVPDEERLDKRLYQMFFVWFSSNFNVLAFSTGCAGPAFFYLSLRDSLIIILVVDAMSSFEPRIMTP